MEITIMKDIITDERGNYYVAVQRREDELVLVNALVERSYRDVLEFTPEFRERYAAYEGQFVGKIAADRLRHDVVFAAKDDVPSRIYSLADVERHCRIVFLDTIEFYRHPRQEGLDRL